MIVQKSNEIILQKERIKNSKDSINKNKQFLEEVNNNIQKLLNDKLLLEKELLKLKEKQKELLKEFAAATGDHQPEQKGFFDKVKQLFD